MFGSAALHTPPAAQVPRRALTQTGLMRSCSHVSAPAASGGPPVAARTAARAASSLRHAWLQPLKAGGAVPRSFEGQMHIEHAFE